MKRNKGTVVVFHTHFCLLQSISIRLSVVHLFTVPSLCKYDDFYNNNISNKHTHESRTSEKNSKNTLQNKTKNETKKQYSRGHI